MKFEFLDKSRNGTKINPDYRLKCILHIDMHGEIFRSYDSECEHSWQSMPGKMFRVRVEDGSFSAGWYEENIFIPYEYIETIFTEDGLIDTAYCEYTEREEAIRVAHIDGAEIEYAGYTILSVKNPEKLYAMGSKLGKLEL